jgi:thioesterase domain-containing protein
MAQQLRRAGERIGCLIILDSNFAESLWPRQYRLRIMAKRLGDRIAEFAATPPQYRLLYLTHMRDIVLKKFGRVPPAMPQETLGPMAAHEIAFAQYAPAFYDGKIIFFRAACEDYPADPRALWRNRTRELEIHFATGGHLSMLDPENAATLAPKISACLQLAL